MPNIAILHVVGLSKAYGQTLLHMRERYGKRGVNLSWVSPSQGDGLDYRASYRKALDAAEGILLFIGPQHGPEVPKDEVNVNEGDTKAGQSYLEYAADLASKKAVPVGVFLVGPAYPTDEDFHESPEKQKRQEAFRNGLKKRFPFVKTIRDDSDLASANTAFRDYLRSGTSSFSAKWILIPVMLFIVIGGTYGLHKRFNPDEKVQFVETTVEERADMLFGGKEAPPEIKVREAEPLPPELLAAISARTLDAKVKVDPAVAAELASNLGKLRRVALTQQRELAKRALSQFIPQCKKLLGSSHAITLESQLLAGEIADSEGQVRVASRIFEETARVASEELGDAHDVTRAGLSKYGSTELKLGEFDKAETSFRKLSKVLTTLPQDKHVVEISTSRFSLALSILEQKRPEEALPLLEISLSDALSQLGTYNHRTQLIRSLITRCQNEIAAKKAKT